MTCVAVGLPVGVAHRGQVDAGRLEPGDRRARAVAGQRPGAGDHVGDHPGLLPGRRDQAADDAACWAQSPIAKMRGSLVRSRSSTTMPRSDGQPGPLGQAASPGVRRRRPRAGRRAGGRRRPSTAVDPVVVATRPRPWPRRARTVMPSRVQASPTEHGARGRVELALHQVPDRVHARSPSSPRAARPRAASSPSSPPPSTSARAGRRRPGPGCGGSRRGCGTARPAPGSVPSSSTRPRSAAARPAAGGEHQPVVRRTHARRPTVDTVRAARSMPVDRRRRAARRTPRPAGSASCTSGLADLAGDRLDSRIRLYARCGSAPSTVTSCVGRRGRAAPPATRAPAMP